MSETNRPNNIAGYVHPSKSTYTRTSIYKTFTEGEKGKKKFGRTNVGDNYATYGSIDGNNDGCPVCQGEVIYTCPCAYNDKKCQNNHIWYTNRDGSTKQGNPHK